MEQRDTDLMIFSADDDSARLTLSHATDRHGRHLVPDLVISMNSAMGHPTIVRNRLAQMQEVMRVAEWAFAQVHRAKVWSVAPCGKCGGSGRGMHNTACSNCGGKGERHEPEETP